MSKNFYTAKEIAKILKVNTLTIYEYIKTSELPAIKFGRNYRVEEKDFNNFINKHKVAAPKN